MVKKPFKAALPFFSILRPFLSVILHAEKYLAKKDFLIQGRFFILLSLKSELLFTTLLKKSRHFSTTSRNGMVATLWPFSVLSPLFVPS